MKDDNEYRELSTVLTQERITTPAERRRAMSILFASMIGQGAGQTVLFALLPPLSRDLGLSEVQVTSIFAISAGFWVFSSTYWGRKSDRWGRKPVMIIGLIAFMVSLLIFALALQAGVSGVLSAAVFYPLMLFARLIYGVAGSGTFPAAQAYIADRTTREERTQGIATVTAAFGLGTMIGPGIATMLAAFSLIAPFYAIVLLAGAAAVAIWWFLPERTPPKQREENKVRLSWFDRRIFPFVVFTTVLAFVSSIPIQTMGFFFMDVLNVGGETAAHFIMIGQVVSSMAALFAQLVVVQRSHFSVRQLTNYGLIMAVVSNVIFLVGFHFGPLVFALLISGLGFGIARPGLASAASLAVSPKEQGAVAGIIGGAGAAGFIAAPLTGLMYQVSPFLPYGVGAAVLVLLFVWTQFSPTLRSAGVILPDPEVTEQTQVSPVSNA
jgi:MFS family permease